MLLFFDERLGVDAQGLAQGPQECGGAVQADGRLQVGAVEGLAEQAAVLAVHADIGMGLGELGHLGEVCGQGEDHVHFGTNALDEPTNLGEVAGHVETAVGRPNDVDLGLLARAHGLGLGHLLGAVFRPEPEHGPVGGLPLVFIDRARQKPRDVHALGGYAAANHLGNRARDHHGGEVWVQAGMGAVHGALGAFAAELLLSKASDHDGQFMRGQCIGVVQDRGDRQVLAAHRAIDDHLQALDGREDIHSPPVAAGAIVVEDHHVPIASEAALAFFF